MSERSFKAILRLFLITIINMLILVLLSSCCIYEEESQEENDEIIYDETAKQFESDPNEPLNVFYTEAGLLLNFQALYPEFKLNTHLIYPNVDNESVGLDYWVKKYGEPDIILLKDWSGFDIMDEYLNGRIQNINEYVWNDDTINTSDYVTGTFEVLDTGDALIGLPLSWYKRCIIVREPYVNSSDLYTLPEDYTGRMLFEAFLHELQKEDYYEQICWTYGYDLVDTLGELQELAIEDDKAVEIDEEIFKMLYQFSVTHTVKDKEARESIGYTGEYISQYQGNPALDPEMYNGDYFGCTLWGAPQITAIYAKSVAELHQEGIRLYWIPNTDSSEEYTGLVSDYAMIGANSTRKQQAYEVIRLMMDMPIEIMTQPEGNAPETYSSVNIDCAIEMLDQFDSENLDLVIRNHTGNVFYTVEKMKLDNAEKEKIKEVITGISGLYLDATQGWDSILSSTYADYEQLSIESGKINHRPCYYEYMHILNPHSDKWNLSSEDLEKYLNSEEPISEITTETTSTTSGTKPEKNDDVEILKNELRDKQVGETFTFGETEQDNDLENGPEPIEWIILEKEDEQIFVISKKVLEYLPFEYLWLIKEKGDWVGFKSDFSWYPDRNKHREWLEQELYTKGFSQEEQALIKSHKNITSGTFDANYQTEDFLYIPTKGEIETYIVEHEILMAEPSEYVKSKLSQQEGNYIIWALRNEGKFGSKYSMQVLESGEISEVGLPCNSCSGVRPVMWLDIE